MPRMQAERGTVRLRWMWQPVVLQSRVSGGSSEERFLGEEREECFSGGIINLMNFSLFRSLPGMSIQRHVLDRQDEKAER